MRALLQDIRTKLNKEYYQNEEHVRLSLICRILQELGWDIWNPKEVNTEFPVVPKEDYTKVDIALFLNHYIPPSVFIEIKSVGRVESELKKVEKQLRDYNRNHTATFTILTDGKKWRFYYSQTAGEFSQKCFKIIDLLNDDLDEIESSLLVFLSKNSIASDKAKNEAKSYLQMNQKQRALEDAFPKAKKLTMEPPFPSLPEAISDIVSSFGFQISEEESVEFIQENLKAEPRITQSPSTDITKRENIDKASTSKKNDFPPPNDTQCRFVYKGKEYKGVISNGKLKVNEYGNFTSFSAASKQITQTSRNGWRDWELLLPSSENWILADDWRKG